MSARRRGGRELPIACSVGRRTSAASADSTATYTWNPLGQLTSVATPQTTATYSYGISGMREKAVVTTGGTTKTTQSVWDGMRLAAERDGDGTLYRYIYAPDGTPLALTKGSGEGAVTYAYHTDALGSVVAITDPAGTVVARYRYDAFGRVTYAGGSDASLAARNPLRYRAYYHDAATGFYYLPARYYDPATARFLSPDPASPSAGDPLSLNAYAYCVGDPVNSYDPSGAVTDVERGAWDHYYTNTGGNRPAAEAKTTQTLAGANARRAAAAGNAAAAAAASARAAAAADAYVLAMAQRAGQEQGSMVFPDASEPRYFANPEGTKQAFGVFAFICSMPPASVALMAIGGLMVVAGVDLAFKGGAATATVLGAPVGGPMIAGGTVLAAVGVGIISAGATSLEAETGIHIPVLSLYSYL